MRSYGVIFKGWNGKRPHLVIVDARNPQDAKQRAAADNPGWMAIDEVFPV